MMLSMKMKMKMKKYFIPVISGIFLLQSCGKPNDPETLVPVDTSGGYKIVTRLGTPGYAQDLVRSDTLLYMAQGEGGLLIVSVKDPLYPQIVSITTDEVRGYSAKVAIKDSVVYLAAGTFGITVINSADPSNPFVTVANLGIKPARNISVFGNYMFTATSEQGVSISDVSYPEQPDIRGGISTSGYAYGLAFTPDSSYLLVACGEMGLSIFDISDFQQGYGIYPLAGWCDTPGYAESVTINGDEPFAYLACGTGGLQILDFSDTTNIHIVGSYPTGGYAKELLYSDGKIFLTAEKLGLQIIDVTDVTSPSLIGQVDTEYALGLDADENYIYIADEVEGLIVISIPYGISSHLNKAKQRDRPFQIANTQ
jgi:hypothetical protein